MNRSQIIKRFLALGYIEKDAQEQFQEEATKAQDTRRDIEKSIGVWQKEYPESRVTYKPGIEDKIKQLTSLGSETAESERAATTGGQIGAPIVGGGGGYLLGKLLSRLGGDGDSTLKTLLPWLLGAGGAGAGALGGGELGRSLFGPDKEEYEEKKKAIDMPSDLLDQLSIEHPGKKEEPEEKTPEWKPKTLWEKYEE